METASDNEDAFDDELPKMLTLQEAYDKLCTKFIKSKRTSHLCRKELNEVKTEKAELLDVHEIYTIKYSHIYIFSLTFMLFCD